MTTIEAAQAMLNENKMKSKYFQENIGYKLLHAIRSMTREAITIWNMNPFFKFFKCKKIKVSLQTPLLLAP